MESNRWLGKCFYLAVAIVFLGTVEVAIQVILFLLQESIKKVEEL
jgi:hypothetical protein